MKTKVFIILFTALLVCCGCGDERLSQPMEMVYFYEPPLWLNFGNADGSVGPPPEEIADLLWGNVDTYLENKHRQEAILDPEHVWHDSVIDRIAEIHQSREYYQKYINAGGIAVVGSGVLEDRHFYAARDLILGMTVKRPELRKLMSPSHEERESLTEFQPLSRKFRMIIYHPNLGSQAIPELFPKPLLASIGACTLRECYSTTQIVNNTLKLNVVAHEFAHAIHSAILTIDASFQERLTAAYEDMKTKKISYFYGTYGATNAGEYWAEASTAWFFRFSFPTRAGENRYSRFRETEPLMHALLEEWYEFIYLGDIEVRHYR